jgi:phosphotransferase system, enzyme I, PtsP
MPNSAPRLILRHLNEVMMSTLPPQDKLDRIVDLIADALASEVCSIYILRESMLELYATHGLAKSAVHVTRLGFGQGLVGTIAEQKAPLNLAEARSHPNFQYRPETGEESFHSFAGVPVMRIGQAVGVLAVQHKDPRSYTDEEIEALQTVAVVMSEVIFNAGILDDKTVAEARATHSGPLRLGGLKLVDGLARGVAVFHEPRVVIEHTVAEDIDLEKRRVREAFTTMRAQIDRMMGQAEFLGGGEHDDILQTYKMFAFDEGWGRRIDEAIDSGLTAEAAIERVQQRTRVSMRRTQDVYLLERLHDLDDLANRLIRIVAGKMGTAANLGGLDAESILVARNLGPAELLEYDRSKLKGVILEEGSPTAHVTILARALGIPMLGRAHALKDIIAPGDPIILDVSSEAAFVRPSSDMVRAYGNRIALRAKKLAEYAAVRDLPSDSADGTRIGLMMNAGLRLDLPALDATNADGIGLFRTEFQFMVAAALPSRQAQAKLYREVLEAAGDRPVIFRTVDIGGDKAVPYLRGETEENPAMGWRALRVALERTGLLKVQARALLEASAGRTLHLMFPMVTQVREFDAAKAIVDSQLAAMRARKLPEPTEIRYGCMLEVPALAFELDALLPRVDFLSIGTNDLVQFLFAADRGHPKLADRYDWLSVPILRFLKRVLDAAHAAHKPVTICGEMGGRTLEAMTLLGLGVRRLSITPAAVGPVKMMIRSLDIRALERELVDLLQEPEAPSRQHLTAWAAKAGVVV